MKSQWCVHIGYTFVCNLHEKTSPQDTLRRPELYRRLPALTFDDNNINGRAEPNRAVEISWNFLISANGLIKFIISTCSEYGQANSSRINIPHRTFNIPCSSYRLLKPHL
uniref:Uncharacterized protein n=1 Tax=Glossina austeni TaxID=7395 RepID=A0A1A9UL93_GLOAU